MQLNKETIAFIEEHLHDDVRALALKAGKLPQVDLTAALTQIAGRQIAAVKIPSWQLVKEILYPQHLSMEQCSSEVTARYKAELVSGDTLCDLTGGFGVDCAFLSAGFKQVTYVEQQSSLCELAANNYGVLGLNHIKVVNEDGVAYLEKMEPVDCIFMDPARRNEHGGKTVAIADCTPDVGALQCLLTYKAQRVMIKLSPMLDLALTLQTMHSTCEVHIVSVNNECKELLLILAAGVQTAEPEIHCVNLTHNGKQCFSFTRSQEQEATCTYADDTALYLYEPNASILKAGGFKVLSAAYCMKKLHPNSHLYTSDELVADFPGRVFRIEKSYSFNKKEMKDLLGNISKANISIRNFPSTVDELRKRTKLKDGGDVYLFATTLNSGDKVLLECYKV
ncbi:MAG TPA: SAM-dependent methyltransferase [Bacteroides graminisolvens]|nr:SAM-dependent methyltransferase [Bacteroides graminisolvens]